MTRKDYAKIFLIILVLVVLALAYIVATHQGPFTTTEHVTYTGDVYQVSVTGEDNLTCTGPDCDAALMQQEIAPTPVPTPVPDRPAVTWPILDPTPALLICGGGVLAASVLILWARGRRT